MHDHSDRFIPITGPAHLGVRFARFRWDPDDHWGLVGLYVRVAARPSQAEQDEAWHNFNDSQMFENSPR